jgi:hypothetical protein
MVLYNFYIFDRHSKLFDAPKSAIQSSLPHPQNTPLTAHHSGVHLLSALDPRAPDLVLLQSRRATAVRGVYRKQWRRGRCRTEGHVPQRR